MKSLKRRSLPDPKSMNLIPPDMDYIYFEGSDSVRLEPGSIDYSPANAWWFAECAFLSYCHPGFARMAYKLAGFTDFRFFQGTGTECMVAASRKLIVVAFRGTELKSRSVLHEIRTDLNTIPVPFDMGGRVHKGFLLALGEIWDGPEGLSRHLQDLEQKFPKRPMWMAGHSLGGALAALCFARTPKAKGLYVFGAPRVGDRDFVGLLENRPAWRIENARDPVPLVPPDVPSLKFNYADLGSLKFLKADGSLSDTRPEFVLDDQKGNYREAKDTLDERIRELNEIIISATRNREKPLKLLSKIKALFRRAHREQKDLWGDFLRKYGLNTDHHQPIYYTTGLWNLLVEEA